MFGFVSGAWVQRQGPRFFCPYSAHVASVSAECVSLEHGVDRLLGRIGGGGGVFFGGGAGGEECQAGERAPLHPFFFCGWKVNCSNTGRGLFFFFVLVGCSGCGRLRTRDGQRRALACSVLFSFFRRVATWHCGPQGTYIYTYGNFRCVCVWTAPCGTSVGFVSFCCVSQRA